MKLPTTVWGASLIGAAVVAAAANGLPVDKVYGVNLGSWLVSEPWMFPKEWQAMGGEICDADCSKCAAHEFGLVQKLGQTKANQVFEKHWSTWFTQKDVDALVDANLNTVRIPLGYWIVEDLVDRSEEFYPQGGMKHLKAGLRMLKAKGIHVILDLHALPGVATPNQMFAGRCTSDVRFYTEENYNRALTWASVMTTLVHTDPDFSTVFAIEAINEPIMDANQTPGYGEYQKNFVKVVRSVEESLGVRCPNVERSKIFPSLASTNSTSTPSIGRGLLPVSNLAEPTIASVLRSTANYLPNIAKQLGIPEPDLRRVIGTGAKAAPSADAQMEEINHGHGAGRSSGHLGANGPVQANITKRSEFAPVIELGSLHDSNLERRNDRRRHHSIARAYVTSGQPVQRPGECLMTSFMNKDWQFNNGPNPADAAIGPQLYDAHLYFNFGGVADPNAESYMRVICNTDRVQRATAQKNRPLVFGEWSLATNFDASNQFVRDWSDAQRHIYAGQADGWIFWSMKIEPGSVYIPAWSYFDALKAGYFSKDPSKLSNPNVCDRWVENKTANKTVTA